MNRARTEILARARAAVASAPAPEVPRAYVTAGNAKPDQNEPSLELFCRRLADYGAGVGVGAREEAGALLARAAAAHGARRLAAPAASPWAVDGVEMVPDEPPLRVDVLERLDGAVTGCALAIAQTGTIVLDGGPRSGRRALTLVPDFHLCVVEAVRIVPRVPDAIALIEQEGLQRRPLTFVSGPSATSDIGFERVEGVHGPRRLEVVVVTAATAAG